MIDIFKEIEGHFDAAVKKTSKVQKTENLIIVIGDGEIETSDPVTVETPDGKKIMIYEDCGEWVVIVR